MKCKNVLKTVLLRFPNRNVSMHRPDLNANTLPFEGSECIFETYSELTDYVWVPKFLSILVLSQMIIFETSTVVSYFPRSVFVLDDLDVLGVCKNLFVYCVRDDLSYCVVHS